MRSPASVGTAPCFVKIECFCFTEQTLAPGGAAQMPITSGVDPDIALDDNLDDVGTITLSYTFFRNESAGAARNSARLADETRSVD